MPQRPSTSDLPFAAPGAPAPAPAASQAKEDSVPLPGWLTKLYYIFPIVLYVPDSIFNFYVYSDGSGIDFNHITITETPLIGLWAFLAVGIVGMAWLLSVLAPWHWTRGNRFQAVMCWIGVIIATSITIWNSLAYRSQRFSAFTTDRWFAQAFHVTLNGFSPTMILVSVAPPFWGLFWAIVQPAVQRRSLAEEQESHVMRMERLKQEAEIKRLKAEANAQVRQAQLKGLVATVRSAREQIAGGKGEPDGSVQVTPIDAPRVVALPAGSVRRLSAPRYPEETTESGEHAIVRGTAASMSFSTAVSPHDGVFQAPAGDESSRGSLSGESETVLSTTRAGMPRASTLYRNYAQGDHIMREVDAAVERMRAAGMKITVKSFAEYRGIELALSKKLLANWREWKQQQAAAAQDDSTPMAAAE
jgi:hypothetical protein